SASISSTTPTAVASSVLPGRQTFIQNPISTAIGMVQAIVNTPHGLSLSAFTTTRASTASRITMMASTATMVSTPVSVPVSSLAIWPSDFPSRRIDANRMMKSCTAPPSTTPITIQIVPGRYPNWAASTGPTSGPGPAMAAKWCPNSTQREVGTKSRPFASRSAGGAGGGRRVVEVEKGLGQEGVEEAVGDGVGAEGGEPQPGGVDGLAAMEGQPPPTGGARHGDEKPPEFSKHMSINSLARVETR